MTRPEHCAGVDEAGRGPLAGPVVVAAVVLPAHHGLDGLDDSKRLPVEVREALEPRIRQVALRWSVQVVDVDEIDQLNILRATFVGMQRAVAALEPRPELVLVDGNRAPEFGCEARAIIGGDRCVPAISAASILAKVARDAIMDQWHARHPEYGFDHNRGYPTPEHLDILRRLGPCPIHRRSFKPVRDCLEPGLF